MTQLIEIGDVVIKAGDVVEVKLPDSHMCASWNGCRLLITQVYGFMVHGTVLPAYKAKSGEQSGWFFPDYLTIVAREPANVYLDHLYDRIIANSSKEDIAVF